MPGNIAAVCLSSMSGSMTTSVPAPPLTGIPSTCLSAEGSRTAHRQCLVCRLPAWFLWAG